jgi:RNA polymerase sigma factor (sigma-70 family)
MAAWPPAGAVCIRLVGMVRPRRFLEIEVVWQRSFAMVFAQEPQASNLRKFEPDLKLPDARFFKTLDREDQKTIERLCTETSECVWNELFEQRGVERKMLAACPDDDDAPARGRIDNDDSGVDMLVSSDGEVLSVDDERHLFLRFNYARYRIIKALATCQGKRLSAAAAREALKWQQLVLLTQNEITRMNVPLVLAMVKRTKIANVDYSDLISEGNMALLRSVDKFDCARGYKFSTYACRAILKAFARVASRTARYRGYFPTEYDPALEKSDFVDRKREGDVNDCVSEIRSLLESRQTHLNDVEQQVIKARFAVGKEIDEAQTLEEVGSMIGVTKERVRQIQNKALRKLRIMLEEGILAG